VSNACALTYSATFALTVHRSLSPYEPAPSWIHVPLLMSSQCSTPEMTVHWADDGAGGEAVGGRLPIGQPYWAHHDGGLAPEQY